MSFPKYTSDDAMLEANRREKDREEAVATLTSIQSYIDGFASRIDDETILSQLRRAMRINRVEGRLEVVRNLPGFHLDYAFDPEVAIGPMVKEWLVLEAQRAATGSVAAALIAAVPFTPDPLRDEQSGARESAEAMCERLKTKLG